MNQVARVPELRVVISVEQLQKRVRELARQISDDYQGRTVHTLAMLENGFMFMADLVRAMDVPVICQFIKPQYRRHLEGKPEGFLEIFFSHDADIRGQHVLLIEGIIHSGVTTEFLVSDLLGRGAASVKVVTLLDRQTARRVPFQPDYFGFLVDDGFLVGYGLSSAAQTERNLSFIASSG
jgi:hypoxanthine phosphoribosyltransferase